MPRPIWTGHISFGLVNIPVGLYTAEERNASISFNLLDRRNNARIKNKRVNEATGEDVPNEEIIKGYKLEDGTYVTFTKEELNSIELDAGQNIEIQEFVNADEIGYAYFDKPYNLLPGKKGDKGYVLLREALKQARKVGIAKVMIRTSEYLGALIPQGRSLMLVLLRYENEIRKPEEDKLPTENLADYKVSDMEISMAEQLIDSMTDTWDPSKYRDEYTSQLQNWIEERSKDGGVAPPGHSDDKTETTDVIDIMEMLKASMQSSKKSPRKKA